MKIEDAHDFRRRLKDALDEHRNNTAERMCDVVDRLGWDHRQYRWLRRLLNRGATQLTASQSRDFHSLCCLIGTRPEAILYGSVEVRRYSLAEIVAIGAQWIAINDGVPPNDTAKRIVDRAMAETFGSELLGRGGGALDQAAGVIQEKKKEDARQRVVASTAATAEQLQNMGLAEGPVKQVANDQPSMEQAKPNLPRASEAKAS